MGNGKRDMHEPERGSSPFLIHDRSSPAERWDARYREGVAEQTPARALLENLHLLPSTGCALDLACGLGANAVVLARAGLATHAWDVSPVAIARLAELAAAEGLALHAAVRDVVETPPEPARFDVIVVARFLERTLAPALTAALKPGGLLFYETFAGPYRGTGPSNPDWRLAEGELLRLFAPLRPRVYREELDAGDPARGWRGMALLVAEKPR